MLKKKIFTEKISDFTSKGVYGFEFDLNDSKEYIKKTIEEAYSVSVKKIRTLNVRRKSKLFRTKFGANIGYESAYKKAYVTLKSGNSIEIY